LSEPKWSVLNSFELWLDYLFTRVLSNESPLIIMSTFRCGWYAKLGDLTVDQEVTPNLQLNSFIGKFDKL